jgi:hypothetical protein
MRVDWGGNSGFAGGVGLFRHCGFRGLRGLVDLSLVEDRGAARVGMR